MSRLAETGPISFDDVFDAKTTGLPSTWDVTHTETNMSFNETDNENIDQLSRVSNVRSTNDWNYSIIAPAAKGEIVMGTEYSGGTDQEDMDSWRGKGAIWGYEHGTFYSAYPYARFLNDDSSSNGIYTEFGDNLDTYGGGTSTYWQPGITTFGSFLSIGVVTTFGVAINQMVSQVWDTRYWDDATTTNTWRANVDLGWSSDIKGMYINFCTAVNSTFESWFTYASGTTLSAGTNGPDNYENNDVSLDFWGAWSGSPNNVYDSGGAVTGTAGKTFVAVSRNFGNSGDREWDDAVNGVGAATVKSYAQGGGTASGSFFVLG